MASVALLAGAVVVWARRLGAESDAGLIRYFSDRRVWLAPADGAQPRLLPYGGRAAEGAGAGLTANRAGPQTAAR